MSKVSRALRRLGLLGACLYLLAFCLALLEVKYGYNWSGRFGSGTEAVREFYTVIESEVRYFLQHPPTRSK